MPEAALAFHSLSNLFPLIEGAAFEELVADVRQHGVREPVVLYEGKILDGRHRYRASILAGIECPTRIYDGDDPLGYMISLNLKRRHLNESQRAMVAARLANMRQGARTDLRPSANLPEVGQPAAATMLNVSEQREPRAGGVDRLGVALVRVPAVRSAMSARLLARSDRLQAVPSPRLRIASLVPADARRASCSAFATEARC